MPMELQRCVCSRRLLEDDGNYTQILGMNGVYVMNIEQALRLGV